MSGKRAIIDIGSNTVRLVVYNGPARAPVVLLNEKITPRLGRDVARDGVLSTRAMKQALEALARYAALLRLSGVEDVQTVATAASRDAANGADFIDAIAGLGLRPRLLSGVEEGQFSAVGVMAAFPGAHGIVADLGGGSLELVRIERNTLGQAISLPFGTLRLPEMRADGAEAFAKAVRKGLKAQAWSTGEGVPLYLVGGSLRAFALYAMHTRGWPLEDPHAFELAPQDAAGLSRELAEGKLDSAHLARVSSSRAATLPDASALLGALIAQIAPSRIVSSSWGLREGLLFAGLEPDVQALDPLLTGVSAFAERYSVDTMSALRMAEWIVPLFGPGEARLRQASALLSLAAMRTEPNLRAEEATDWALRKRWIGLDARGRALIAMAVLGATGRVEPGREFAGLVPKAELRNAAGWGLALRFCSRLTAGAPAALTDSRLERREGTLHLTLGERTRPLYAASAAKSFGALADHLGLEPAIRESA